MHTAVPTHPFQPLFYGPVLFVCLFLFLTLILGSQYLFTTDSLRLCLQGLSGGSSQKAHRETWDINAMGLLASPNLLCLPVLAVSSDSMVPGLGREKRDSTERESRAGTPQGEPQSSRPEFTENTAAVKKETESQSPSIFVSKVSVTSLNDQAVSPQPAANCLSLISHGYSEVFLFNNRIWENYS